MSNENGSTDTSDFPDAWRVYLPSELSDEEIARLPPEELEALRKLEEEIKKAQAGASRPRKILEIRGSNVVVLPDAVRWIFSQMRWQLGLVEGIRVHLKTELKGVETGVDNLSYKADDLNESLKRLVQHIGATERLLERIEQSNRNIAQALVKSVESAKKVHLALQEIAGCVAVIAVCALIYALR